MEQSVMKHLVVSQRRGRDSVRVWNLPPPPPHPTSQVCVLLIRNVIFQKVVDGNDPAVVELSVQGHLLLLHLRLDLHHF